MKSQSQSSRLPPIPLTQKPREAPVAYGVIHNSIFQSSVSTDWQAWVVLVAMCVLADEDDNVLSDVPRLARHTNLPEEVVVRGIAALSAPDPSSKNPREEGRRIVPIDADRPGLGWHIVNREIFKRMFSAEHRRQYKKNWMKERARKKED